MDDERNSNLDVQDDVEIQTVNFPNENLPSVPFKEPQVTILQDEQKEKLGKKPVYILFIGLSGAGKSTLVNVMLAKVAAKTGCGPDSIEASKSHYEGEFEGVKLQVYDTNGYSESNHKIPKSGSFDLILICIKITNRLSDSEKNLLKALGKAFDKEAWKRTVIVLTFANLLLQDSKIKYLASEEAQCEVMNKLMEEYKECITKQLEGYMDKEIAHNIPFCLAGESHPHDPTIRSVRKLPTAEDWLVDLWKICANRINPEYKPWFDRLIDYIREAFFKMFKRKMEDQQQDEEGQQVEEQQDEEGQQVEEQQDEEGQQNEEQQDKEGQQVEEQQDKEGQQVEEQQDKEGQQVEEQQDKEGQQVEEQQNEEGQQVEEQQDKEGQQVEEQQNEEGQQVEEQQDEEGQQVEEQQVT